MRSCATISLLVHQPIGFTFLHKMQRTSFYKENLINMQQLVIILHLFQLMVFYKISIINNKYNDCKFMNKVAWYWDIFFQAAIWISYEQDIMADLCLDDNFYVELNWQTKVWTKYGTHDYTRLCSIWCAQSELYKRS